jgi:hypothetical protein
MLRFFLVFHEILSNFSVVLLECREIWNHKMLFHIFFELAVLQWWASWSNDSEMDCSTNYWGRLSSLLEISWTLWIKDVFLICSNYDFFINCLIDHYKNSCSGNVFLYNVLLFATPLKHVLLRWILFIINSIQKIYHSIRDHACNKKINKWSPSN